MAPADDSDFSPDPATDLEAFARRRLGQVLRGKYRLDRILGAGGMAVVYKATHRNQAEFAVKMLHPQISMMKDVRQRFLREGYAANSVKHAGVVHVVDDDVDDDGAAFLVMELLDGVEVEKYCEGQGGRLMPAEACGIIVQLLDVLDAAHAKGIVHRDIKPANLFLTRDGSIKVLDFGIARARDAMPGGGGGGIHATGTGVMLGTPAFMSPEQVLGKAGSIDGQADVWSAGATLFTLVSGECVHEGETASQLLVHAATAPARPLASVVPGIPQAICDVVDRALAFEKVDRWPTAGAMRDALVAACIASFRRPPGKVPPDIGVVVSVPGTAAASQVAFSETHAAESAAVSPGATAPARRFPQTTGVPFSTEAPAPAPSVAAGTNPTQWLLAAALVLGAIGVAATLRAYRSSSAASDAHAGDTTEFVTPSAPAAVPPSPPPVPVVPTPLPSAITSAPLPSATVRTSGAPRPPPPSQGRGKQNPLDLPFK